MCPEYRVTYVSGRTKKEFADFVRENIFRLAKELHVHVRTLQAAVRTGRLAAHFSVKSVFGRPRRLATRAAAEQFMATHYRRFSGQEICPAPPPTVPNDYDRQLGALRRRLRLTQDGLARRVGAAGKAVIYQWELRKRTPSPVLWQQVLRLPLVSARTVEARAAGPRSSRRKGRTPSQDSCGGGIHTELGLR